MAAGSSLAMEPKDRVLIITRIFDAPRELVWKAWTEPERMVKWHGPLGFTSTIERLDFRPGGAFESICAGQKTMSIGRRASFAKSLRRSGLSWPAAGPMRKAVQWVPNHCDGHSGGSRR